MAGVPAGPAGASYDGGVSTGGEGAADAQTRSPLAPGTKVDVRNRFQGTWVRGFEIAEVTGEGYRIRRMSDGSVLGEQSGWKEEKEGESAEPARHGAASGDDKVAR